MKVRLVTGGCGFIGSNFIRHLIESYPEDFLLNLDLLTYAGNPKNLEGIDEKNYRFIQGDICDQKLVRKLFEEHPFDEVINFAAESHVDNSILGPRVFIETNVTGTLNLLDTALNFWRKGGGFLEGKRFLQVSTDEVYGSLEEGSFLEDSLLNPSSPYSSSKASADLITLSYFLTYGMPVLISRCTNNFGPFQNQEKLLPLMITQAFGDKKLPVYGDGNHVRDWLYVKDHCRAISLILERGRRGEIYNIGAGEEWKNIDLVKLLLEKLGKPESLIEFVEDRPGHDRRYSVDSSKIRRELGWKPEADFENHLDATIEWFRAGVGAR